LLIHLRQITMPWVLHPFALFCERVGKNIFKFSFDSFPKARPGQNKYQGTT
jgi:hypothetical protein